MKKILQFTAALLLFAVVVSFSACTVNKTEGEVKSETEGKIKSRAGESLWDDADYTSDTALGSGSKTLTVEVSAEDKTVTFTVKTDEETVGAALKKLDLIEGEEGAYGLYIEEVNDIEAEYDEDGAYWAFYIDGELAAEGADATVISEESIYRFEYTK